MEITENKEDNMPRLRLRMRKSQGRRKTNLRRGMKRSLKMKRPKR